MKVRIVRDEETLASLYKPDNHETGCPFQDISYLKALLQKPGYVVLSIDIGHVSFITAFDSKPGSNIAKCAIPTSPFVGAYSPGVDEREFSNLLTNISDSLQKPLYFPQVYENSEWSKVMQTQARVDLWTRLPSPTVTFDSPDTTLIQVAKERIGSRAIRRLRKFENEGFSIISADKRNASEIIKRVEMTSWKRAQKQDMISRDQLWVYNALVQSPNSVVRVVMNDEDPVAYRFDYRVGQRVFALKWSYNEAYKKYSPGFYLLVKDMEDYWRRQQVKSIDLYGSPDTLKSSICDTSRESKRLDIGWPRSSDVVQNLKRERLEHDAGIKRAFNAGVSLKSIYS